MPHTACCSVLRPLEPPGFPRKTFLVLGCPSQTYPTQSVLLHSYDDVRLQLSAGDVSEDREQACAAGQVLSGTDFIRWKVSWVQEAAASHILLIQGMSGNARFHFSGPPQNPLMAGKRVTHRGQGGSRKWKLGAFDMPDASCLALCKASNPSLLSNYPT